MFSLSERTAHRASHYTLKFWFSNGGTQLRNLSYVDHPNLFTICEQVRTMLRMVLFHNPSMDQQLLTPIAKALQSAK